ncbi:MAG: hypothetical protein IKV83_08755 [Muribaculaceae bacterium]|nr:hypothetical protein [Muribaculaceae bacterium]
MRSLFSISLSLLIAITSFAADPTATKYSSADCQGSLKPYTAPTKEYTYPDSLAPVFINHVGRHGSRFPASATHCKAMLEALENAKNQGTITARGKELLTLVESVMEKANGQWGALDDLGVAEQRGIAARMYSRYPSLFKGKKVEAISSYSPRCVMSMYSFTHQLTRMNNSIELTTASGRGKSSLMRPFDVEMSYKDFIELGAWKEPYQQHFDKVVPTSAIERVLGKDYNYGEINSKDLAIVEYYVIAGMSAMEMECDASKYFTTEEYNALWSCFNLRQYLQRTATTLSSVPADIASPLLCDIIESTDLVVERGGNTSVSAKLRFGHAETLMPLLSLMRLKGCNYKTNYFDTVAKNWQDFNVVPMSANIQFILFKNSKGEFYLRIDRNEEPIAFIPNSTEIYVPWEKARQYLSNCVPLYYQTW